MFISHLPEGLERVYKALMLIGPSTKITLKILLGLRHFALCIACVLAFSLLSGLVINALQ